MFAKPPRYGSMIVANQGVHLVGVDDMHALLRKVKQGFETNKERLSIISLREAVSLGPGCDLL
jgi:hypothetical protein